MSKSEVSKEALDQFLKNMHDSCFKRGYEFFKWKRVVMDSKAFPPHNLHIYGIVDTGHNREQILFIKGSHIHKGWWGISDKWASFYSELINEWKENPDKENYALEWAVILLRSAEVGYLLGLKDFQELISDLNVGKSQIHVSESQLDLKLKFLSLEALLDRLKVGTV